MLYVDIMVQCSKDVVIDATKTVNLSGNVTPGACSVEGYALWDGLCRRLKVAE